MSLGVNNVGMSNYSVSFNGSEKEPVLVNTRKFGDKEERIYETEASSGKKWGVGIASAFCPGLGQAINGDWGKAALFFFSTVAGTIGANLCGFSAIFSEKVSKTKVGAGIALVLGTIGLEIASIVDAVKSAKSTVSEIVPVQKNE